MSKIEEMANSTYFLQQHSGWLIDEELGDVEYGIKVRREAFVKGANYVLECIERTIPSSDDVLENHTKCKSAIFRLQAIIEQLKK